MSDPISNMDSLSSISNPSYTYVPAIVQDSYAGTVSGYKNVKIPVQAILDAAGGGGGSEDVFVARFTTPGTQPSGTPNTATDTEILISSSQISWNDVQERIQFGSTGLYRVTLTCATKTAFGYPWPSDHSQHLVNAGSAFGYTEAIPSPVVLTSRYETTVSNVTNSYDSTVVHDFLLGVGSTALTFGDGLSLSAMVSAPSASGGTRFSSEFAITIRRIGDYTEPA